MITFFVPGNPIPRKAPTFGNGHAHHDDRQHGWKDTIRAYAMKYRPPKPYAGPVRMELTFYMKGNGKTGWHTQRPDFDNLCKITLDALTGVIFIDDSQVCEIQVAKLWDDVSEAGVEITAGKIK
jgi:Holliday junction resolvase RusA-like endonuclease